MNTSLKTLLTVSGFGLAMAAAPAIGQTPSTPSSSTPPATSAAPANTGTAVTSQALMTSGSWRASKLIGLDVYNQSNEKLGDINELILDKDGKVAAVIIGVGGFLGVGERDIAVSLGELRFVEEARPAATASTTTTTRPATAPAANAPAANPRDSMASTTAPAAKTTTTTTAPAYDWVPDHAVMNATKDQLNTMAEFKYTAK